MDCESYERSISPRTMFGTWCRSSEQSTIRAAGCRDRNNPRTCFGLGCAASVVARFGSADGGEVCQPRGCAPCSCNSHVLAPGYILSPLRGCFYGFKASKLAICWCSAACHRSGRKIATAGSTDRLGFTVKAPEKPEEYLRASRSTFQHAGPIPA